MYNPGRPRNYQDLLHGNMFDYDEQAKLQHNKGDQEAAQDVTLPLHAPTQLGHPDQRKNPREHQHTPLRQCGNRNRNRYW